MKYKQKYLFARQQTNCLTESSIPFLYLSLRVGWGELVGDGYSPTNKIQYDNLTSAQWLSHYNHLVYHVPPTSLCEQFLKLLNVHKDYSD